MYTMSLNDVVHQAQQASDETYNSLRATILDGLYKNLDSQLKRFSDVRESYEEIKSTASLTLCAMIDASIAKYTVDEESKQSSFVSWMFLDNGIWEKSVRQQLKATKRSKGFSRAGQTVLNTYYRQSSELLHTLGRTPTHQEIVSATVEFVRAYNINKARERDESLTDTQALAAAQEIMSKEGFKKALNELESLRADAANASEVSLDELISDDLTLYDQVGQHDVVEDLTNSQAWVLSMACLGLDDDERDNIFEFIHADSKIVRKTKTQIATNLTDPLAGWVICGFDETDIVEVTPAAGPLSQRGRIKKANLFA